MGDRVEVTGLDSPGERKYNHCIGDVINEHRCSICCSIWLRIRLLPNHNDFAGAEIMVQPGYLNLVLLHARQIDKHAAG